MAKLTEKEVRERAKNIKLLVLDVDGVLTDGRIIYTSDGKELKNFDVKDGHGIVLARKAGIGFAFISGRNSDVTKIRAADLGVENVFQGIKDKEMVLRELSQRLGVELDSIAYMGDDVIDIPAMRIVGLSVAVADAHQKALEACDWVTTRNGGKGAVREFIDLVLEAKS